MIFLKTNEEIEKMRVASRRAMEILLYLKDFVKEGIKTIESGNVCEEKIKECRNMKAGIQGLQWFSLLPMCFGE